LGRDWRDALALDVKQPDGAAGWTFGRDWRDALTLDVKQIVGIALAACYLAALACQSGGGGQ
jgi:hypothetical protein